ncbi:MAG: hypothetical protein NZM35_09330 [Chitinophagales bacterium]|nr:hypothetical protein [Chitinophagales bacterium]MDW8419410.1 hypothetical protein [Chitinophagales bacterium]
MKNFLMVTAAFMLMCLSFSCRKIQEGMIIKGLWTLEGFYVDTFSKNMMEIFLPYYNTGNGCCRYKIDFQDDDLVTGYYFTHDTLNYLVAGTWKLIKYNKIYVKLDNYVDGEFTIEKIGNKRYEMISDSNRIKAFEVIMPHLDTAYTRIVARRN